MILRPLGAAGWGGAFPVLFGSEPIETISYLTFLQNWRQAAYGGWGPIWLAVTWSLAIEAQFYLLALVLVAITPPRWLLWVSLGIVLAAAAWSIHLGAVGRGFASVVLTSAQLDAPFAGVVACCLARLERVRDFIQRHDRAAKLTASSLLLILYSLSVFSVTDHADWVPGPVVFSALKIVTLGALVLVFAVGTQPRDIGALARCVRWIGIRCFAIYIIHYPVMHLSAHLLYGKPAYFEPGKGLPALGLGLVVTFGLAALSWRYVEEPAIRWSHAYVRRRWSSSRG